MLILQKFKILFIIIPIVFILKIPIFNLYEVICFITLIIIYLSIKQFKKNIEIKSIIFLIILILANLILNNYHIQEKNGIYIPNKLNNTQYENYNKELFEILKKKFNTNYFSKNIKCKIKNFRCWEKTNLHNIFSTNYNILPFNHHNKFIRKIKNINHNDLSSAKIGMINNLDLNWSDWKNNSDIKRYNAPYFIIYTFNDKKYNNSKLCFKGNGIIINKKFKHIHHKTNNCLKVNQGLEILVYNFNSKLDIVLKKNTYIKLLDFLNLFINFICLILIIKIFIKKINLSLLIKLTSIVVFSSAIISSIYFKRKVFEYGYNPLEAGMDGLVHEGLSKILSLNLININFYEYFRGGENIFYFMPGLRYILSLDNIIFGNNFNGIIIIIIFFPLIVYFTLIKLGLGEKFSLIFVLLFILLKIPYIGFSFSHFARGALSVYPETFAAIFFFLFLIFFLDKKYFFAGIFCFLMVFIRPNYFPIFFVYFVYHCYNFLKFHDLNKFFITIFAISFLFLMPLHNYIYGGNSLVFFTSSAFIDANLKINFYEYLNFFQNDELRSKITNHLINWITTGEKNNLFPYIINSFLICNSIFFFFLMIKNKSKNMLLINFFALSQQSVMFFYNNTGRYAYFPWLLVLIVNLLIFKNYYNLFFTKIFNKRSKLNKYY